MTRDCCAALGEAGERDRQTMGYGQFGYVVEYHTQVSSVKRLLVIRSAAPMKAKTAICAC